MPDVMPDGSSWPRITIVTPSYNQGHFIEETIRSVLLQGYPNLEYMIIDGGSTDGSVGIIKKYEPWLSYWVSEPDRGQSHAINKGLSRATGRLLAWINSDDLYVKSSFCRVAQSWEDNHRPGFIHGITAFIDESGENQGQTYGSNFVLQESLLSSVNNVAQPSAFISREAIERVGSLDEDLHMSMDWDLWIRIAAQFPVVFIPQIWSMFRQWEKSKTATIHYKSASDHLVCIRKLRDNQVDGISQSVKRKALAIAYERQSLAAHRQSDYSLFRKSLFWAFIYNPVRKGGNAGRLLLIFLLGTKTLRILSSLKRMLSNRHVH